MNQRFRFLSNLIFAALLLLTTSTMAAVKLPNVLSSNMVLQRGGQTSVWGWANAGEKISVTFRDVTVKTKATKNGKWLVKITTGNAGGPFDLIIKGENSIVLDNVLVGDVWVCSGQSNMEWPLLPTDNGAADVRNANLPNIRLFTVQKNTSVVPLDNTLSAKWELCTPETAKTFSAVGFYFGRKINKETGVPIGLISSNWGGTNVETWTSEEASMTDDIMAEGVKNLKTVDFAEMAKKQQLVFDTYQKVWNQVKKPDFTHQYIQNNFDDSKWLTAQQPQLWENLHEWEVFDGIVWFRKSFEIPANFDLNKATLSLARIDDSDIAWVNGKRVGETFNQYNIVRNYPITSEALKHGKNQLVVRVEDYTGGGGFHGAASEMFLSDGAVTIDLSGDWKMMKDETPTPQNPASPAASVLQPNQYPTLLFNGMINPLLNYAIKGAIWYQGESNADGMKQALRYEKQLRSMISDWRKHWAVGTFPFYMVQLANFKPETPQPVTQVWPFLREAQENLANEEKIGMACIIDIGNPDNIHPTNKIDVGERLAFNALNFDYGKSMIYCGPRKKEASINGDKATITFDFVGDGLKLKNKYGYINGFSVAGDDQIFHYAKASLASPNQVEVTCDKVKNIRSVRFLWADNPGEINLYNSVELPAEPFRTDNW